MSADNVGQIQNVPGEQGGPEEQPSLIGALEHALLQLRAALGAGDRRAAIASFRDVEQLAKQLIADFADLDAVARDVVAGHDGLRELANHLGMPWSSIQAKLAIADLQSYLED